MMTKEDILQLDKTEEYREGNQLEVKAALGDVPNPKGGVRGVIPSMQSYTVKKNTEKPSTDEI